MTYGILTLTCDDPLYNTFDEMKSAYLDRHNINNVFVYNTTEHIENTGKKIYYKSALTGPTGIFTMFDKFIATIKSDARWCEYDFTLRVNSSTFLNIPVLEKYIRDLPREKCYAGACTVPITPKDFISGTCMVLSKDVVKQLTQINNSHENYHREDDLIIFDYMKQLNVQPTNIPMYWYDKDIIPTKEEVQQVLREYPLIRLRNNSNREQIDTTIWRMLLEG
jgi:hypothetical protein